MRKVWACILAVAVISLAGCSSSSHKKAGSRRWENLSPERKKQVEAWIDEMAVLYRAVGRDVKKHGYHLVFTDVGPDSLELDAPEVFAKLLERAKGGGVQFRGFSKAVVDATSVHDRKTRERGVVFVLAQMKDDGSGGADVRGTWYERDDSGHKVVYHLSRQGNNWKVD